MLNVELAVRPINMAVDKAINRRGGNVYCTLSDGTLCRIIHAKSVRGQLVVRRLDNDHWVYPVAVYREW